jgi:hypothetical protein
MSALINAKNKDSHGQWKKRAAAGDWRRSQMFSREVAQHTIYGRKATGTQ